MSGATHESFAQVATACIAGETAAQDALLYVRGTSPKPDAIFEALAPFLSSNVSELDRSAIKGFCRAMQKKIEGGAQ